VTFKETLLASGTVAARPVALRDRVGCRAPELEMAVATLQRRDEIRPAPPLACEHLGPSGFGLPPVFSPEVGDSTITDRFS